jgi:hypothetical protein
MGIWNNNIYNINKRGYSKKNNKENQKSLQCTKKCNNEGKLNEKECKCEVKNKNKISVNQIGKEIPVNVRN